MYVLPLDSIVNNREIWRFPFTDGVENLFFGMSR